MKYVLFVVLVILFIGGFVFYKVSGDEKPVALIESDNELIELGEVSMADSIAKTYFNIKNIGAKELSVYGAQTSCMCTTVKLIIGDKESPVFGMHENTNWNGKIAAGDSAILEVSFDPNAHGPEAVGPFERIILVKSNADNNDELEVRIKGVVVK
jgi:hypothetical protein